MDEQPNDLPRSRPVAKVHLHPFAAVRRYYDLLIRKWWVMVLGAAVGLTGEYFFLVQKSPEFYSMGRMIVSIKLALPEGSLYTEELGNYLGTQVALMQGRSVAERAAERVLAQHTNLTQQPVTLTVNLTPRTSIFALEAVGTNADYVQAYLQACMEEYVQLKRSMRKQTSDTTLSFMTEEAARVQGELHLCERELLQFENSNTVVLQSDQGSSVSAYLVTLHQRLADMKSEYQLIKALTLDQNVQRRQELASGTPVTPDQTNAAPAPNGTQREDEYLKARQQLLLMKADLQDLGKYLRPKHPKMIALSEEIAQREKLLEILRQQSTEQLETRRISMSMQITNLEKDVKEWDAKNVETSRKIAESQKLKASLKRVQDMSDRLQSTMQSLDVNKEINAEGVTIMEPACKAVIDARGFSKDLRNGALVCLALSIAFLLLFDRMDDRINSVTELQDLFDDPILAQIPREKATTRKGQLKLISPDDDRHSFLEAYRSLRSSLLLPWDSGQRPKTIVVTSAIPNEGKSLTSCNLAITVASAGSKVLLVDADLRKGALHDRFNIGSGEGLHEVLVNGLKWQEKVHSTEHPNLFLLPRGQTTHRAGELFLSAATGTFLKEAAAQYDYVIVDTPPVMAADDVNCLAPHTNGVLFVVRAEKTSARVSHAALELLRQRNVPVLGIVFNAVRPSSADYYYYYKYKDYYKTYPTADGGSSRKKSA